MAPFIRFTDPDNGLETFINTQQILKADYNKQDQKLTVIAAVLAKGGNTQQHFHIEGKEAAAAAKVLRDLE